MEYFISALKKYADFSGRANCKEYWMYILFYVIGSILLRVVDGFLGSPALSSLYSLGLFIPTISIAARRLHDTGRSGWWQLILLVPLIGFIVLIIFLAQDSHEENEFGLKPKTR